MKILLFVLITVLLVPCSEVRSAERGAYFYSMQLDSSVIQLETISDTEAFLQNNPDAVITMRADWCGPCKMLIPTMEALAQELESNGVGVAAVDVDKLSEEDHAAFVNLFPSVNQIPITFIYKDGNLRLSHLGAFNQTSDIYLAINNLFNGLLPGTEVAPSSERNYIMETVVRDSGITSSAQLENLSIYGANRTVRYFDGLGRPVQTVQWQGSPKGQDIVQHIEYDSFGREGRQFLPYAHGGTADGSYKTGGNANVHDFYSAPSVTDIVRTAYPYSETVFEDSPLNRVKEQGAPGGVWQPAAIRDAASGRTVVTDYGTNGTDDVRLWNPTSTGADGSAYYQPGRLYRTIVKDENWVSGKAGTVEEYKDFGDRVVLKRIWESETDSLDTYYVYDDFGDLCYVIPPAVTQSSFTEEPADPVFDSYIYAYRYDGRRRLIEKKIPGRGWEHIVYNRNDQPVLTQDSVQRAKSIPEWNYTKYDAFGRVTETGIFQRDLPRTRLQDTLNAEEVTPSTALWETRGYSAASYDNKSYPRVPSTKTVLTVNYYDNYSFKVSGELPGSSLDSTSNVKTLLTGTMVYKDDGTAGLLTVNYYDSRARLVETVSQNHLGGVDRITNTYSFIGELLTSKREHSPSPSGAAITVLTTNGYDHVGRLVETRKKVDSQPEIIQSRLAYNEIGQLVEKQLHSEDGGHVFIDSIRYAYNERGWLTESSSPHFTQQLAYDDALTGADAQYNGNISQQHWGHGTTVSDTFNYGYDRLNRLLSGVKSGTVMSEVMEYDDMGNITKLTRDDAPAINYTYTGNRLTTLSGGLTGSYIYDANGNATTDRTGMTFAYNHLNLPKTAMKTGTSVSYVYDALGSKLRKTATVGSTVTQRDYVNGIEYSKVGSGASAIEMIHTEEGYLQNNGGTYTYHYNLTDHLGNVRATLQRTTATTGTVIQKHDYYPFGKAKALVTSGINKYLYNGKEIQDEIGGQYDYGARFYDAEIGRWNVVDPLASSYYSHSPYNYTMNNPILFIDPNGMWVSPIYDTEGNFLGTDEEGLQGSAWVMQKENFVQGMSKEEAAKYHTYKQGDPNMGFESQEAALKYANHFDNLPNRPDFDGFVTIDEGIAWAKQNPGARDNPTADNMLYLDASKLDFGNISVSDFGNGVGKSSPINLLNEGNLARSYGNVRLRATVYALGRVDMYLHDKTGNVSIVNNSATDYDWNTGGSAMRNTLIRAERAKTGLNDTHGFKTYYYGRGVLNPTSTR